MLVRALVARGPPGRDATATRHLLGGNVELGQMQKRRPRANARHEPTDFVASKMPRLSVWI